MSFLKENKIKVIIVTLFSLCMAVLCRIYAELEMWLGIIGEGLSLGPIINLVFANWQIWVMFILILAITSLLVFCKKAREIVYKYRYAFAGSVFVLCVIFEISGSSMGQWCNDFGIADKDVLVGISRPVRSDEYGLATPYFISQGVSKSENAYEYFSDYANGMESDMFMGVRQPIKHILSILRPFTLGFLFLSPARGLSFWWCGKIIALFMATFEMGMLLSNKRKSLSCIMAALVAFSSVVSWWFSTSAAEIIIYTEVAMLLFNKYLIGDRLWKRLLLLVGILYLAGCFIMLLYPSWQVPFVYIILVLTVWIVIKNIKAIKLRWYDYASIGVGLAGLAAIFVFIFSKSQETIELISGSVYPGERLETGGGGVCYMFTYPLNMWFTMTNFSFGANVCETATMFDLFPFSIIVPIIGMVKNKKKDILSIMLLALNMFFFVWIVFGFNETLAKITFMSNSQAIRTMLAFSFVNIMLLIRGVSLMKEAPSTALVVGISVGISAIVMIIALIATKDAELRAAYKIIYFGIDFILLGILIFAFLKYDKKNWSLLSVTLVGITSMICGIMVNPIRKGLDSVYEIEWIKEINAVCEEKGDDGIWAVECSNLNALPYTNVGLLSGVKTINATAVYPNPKLWEKFDSAGENSHVYNRFSHIGICIKDCKEPEFELITEDSFKVYMTFDDLKRAGVTYVTSLTDLSEYARLAQCKVTLINDSDIVYIYMLE